MRVELKAMTKPMTDECETSSQLLAYFARVSSTANQLNHATGPRLLRYLVRNKEWSPLEMVSLTIEIETTRDIARQILRHRSFSFQEFSQRYAEVEAKGIIREARLQDHKNRQNSLEALDPHLHDAWQEMQIEVSTLAQKHYKAALEKGIAKEVARALLPEGMTQSRLYMSGTLRSWLHYVLLRTSPGTQKEHRMVANEVRRILIEQFPDIADVFA